MINIKANYYIEIEISLLTKSGPCYSSSLNRRDFQICKNAAIGKRRTMIIFAKIYCFKNKKKSNKVQKMMINSRFSYR